MLTNYLIITVICCFIVNSGAIDSLKQLIWKVLKGNTPYRNFSLKPFDCELCSTWWACLIFMIAVGKVSLLNIMFAALFAYFADFIWITVETIKDIIQTSVDYIRKRL